MNRSSLRAIPFILAACVGLAALDATGKYLSRFYPVSQITWARYAGHLALALALAWRHHGPLFARTRRLPLHLLRSALLLAATLCGFSGLARVPLAEATAVSFLAPVFIVLLSRPLLGERVSAVRWIAVGAGFAGVLLIVRPGGAVFRPAILLMVAMALLNALYQLLTRKLAGEDAYVTLFYTALVGTAGMGLALPWISMPSPRPEHWPLFALLGLAGGGAHLLLIHAYNRAPAGMVTPFVYVQMIWAVLLGALLFDQVPDGLSALGMACIVASGVGLALLERAGGRAGLPAASATRAPTT